MKGQRGFKRGSRFSECERLHCGGKQLGVAGLDKSSSQPSLS